jgi:hypothetical protein
MRRYGRSEPFCESVDGQMPDFLSQMNADPDFEANSRRIRLGALAHYCQSVVRFIDSGIVSMEKLIAKCSVSQLTPGLADTGSMVTCRDIGMNAKNIGSKGRQSCLALSHRIVPISRQALFPNANSSWCGERLNTSFGNAPAWYSYCRRIRYALPLKPPRRWGCTPIRCAIGSSAGPQEISPWKIRLGGGGSPIFPPLDQALVKAVACELVAAPKQPLSRQALADVAARAAQALGQPISRSHSVADVGDRRHQAVAVQGLDFSTGSSIRREGRTASGPVCRHLARSTSWPQGPRAQCRREDQHPSPPPLPSAPAPRSRPPDPYRIRVRARWGLAISGRVGRAPGLRDGPV